MAGIPEPRGMPVRSMIVVSLLLSLLPSSHQTPAFLSRTARSQSDGLCGGALDLKTYFFMNKVCDDCFSLYRDSDIYSACRSGCFGSDFFQGCMDTLILDQETKDKAGDQLHEKYSDTSTLSGYLRSRYGSVSPGFDPLS